MQTDRNFKKTLPFFLPWKFPLKFLSKTRRHLCPSLTPLSLIFQTTGVFRYGLGGNKSTSIQWVKERVILGGDLFSTEMLTTISKVKVPLVFKWTKSNQEWNKDSDGSCSDEPQTEGRFLPMVHVYLCTSFFHQVKSLFIRDPFLKAPVSPVEEITVCIIWRWAVKESQREDCPLSLPRGDVVKWQSLEAHDMEKRQQWGERGVMILGPLSSFFSTS